jgi:Hypothetical glycosyl hydrolase 6/Beta-galactosidase trimerisation domain
MNRRDFASTILKLAGTSSVLATVPPLLKAGEPQDPPQSGQGAYPAPPSLENQYRGYIVDHHSPDPPAITYANFDPEQWLRLYEVAELDHDWVFCKGHHGEAYYPTKVGHMHPGLKVDFVKAISEGLRRRGISFHAYYCIGFDDWAAIHHPAWALLDENGKPRRVDRKNGWGHWGQWHWVCVNTPYRHYVFDQLTEIVKGYNPDGIFLDILGQPLCYCKYCSALYRQRYGHGIPRGGEVSRQRREIDDFLYRTTQLSFVKEVITLVRKLGSKAAITVNGGHLHFRKELMDLLDYTFAEPWAGNYLSAMFARGTGKLPEIGPGQLAEVYDPSPASVFKVGTAMIAAQNCRVFMYSETMHQDGSLDPLWFREMGEAYHDIQLIQPHLLQRDSIRCVAMLFSEKTQFNDGRDQATLRTFSSENQYFIHSASLKGAMEAGVNSQFPSDVLPDWELDTGSLKGYQAIVLPEVTALSDQDAEVIRQFVADGGLLIVTGVSGTRQSDGSDRKNFVLADLIGCDFVRIEKEYLKNFWGSYLERSNDALWKNLLNTNLAVEAPFVVVKPHTGTRVLATHILPAVSWYRDDDNHDEAWVNWEPPPPGKASNYPAILETVRGKGRVFYATFDLYGMVDKGFQWPLELHYQVLRSRLERPPAQVEMDGDRRGVGTTFYRKRTGKALVIHQINLTVPMLRGDIHTMKGGKLRISEDYFQPTTCSKILPAGQAIRLRKNQGFYEIELPGVKTHSVFLVEG